MVLNNCYQIALFLQKIGYCDKNFVVFNKIANNNQNK